LTDNNFRDITAQSLILFPPRYTVPISRFVYFWAVVMHLFSLCSRRTSKLAKIRHKDDDVDDDDANRP